MRLLIVGSGGRESSLAWKISQSNLVEKLFCAPGNAGTLEKAKNVNIASTDIEKLLKFAKKEKINLTLVGPEAPLSQGIADRFKNEGLKIFGPGKQEAKLESSKIFSKKFMQRYGIPTAPFEIFDNKEDAIDFVRQKNGDVVIKADGLASGKGVFVCSSIEEAEDALSKIMEKKIFGSSGDQVVIEKKLVGEEASMIVLCDGENILPLDSSQDHKPIFDFDKGPNTGGMGAYSPAPVLEGEIFNRTDKLIIEPVLRGIKKEMKTYKGVLYVGLMITDEGPYVLEFNVRFGDPELQAILPRLKSDFVEAIDKTTEGKLDEVKLEWDERACVCVVMASGGYPGSYEKGKIITGLDKFKDSDDIIIFHAGTKLIKKKWSCKEQKIVTNGGRVLCVTALGNTIEEAISKSYDAVNKIHFENVYFRKDIGQKALRRIGAQG